MNTSIPAPPTRVPGVNYEEYNRSLQQLVKAGDRLFTSLHQDLDEPVYRRCELEDEATGFAPMSVVDVWHPRKAPRVFEVLLSIPSELIEMVAGYSIELNETQSVDDVYLTKVTLYSKA